MSRAFVLVLSKTEKRPEFPPTSLGLRPDSHHLMTMTGGTLICFRFSPPG